MASSQATVSARDFDSPLALLSYLLEQDDVPISELLLWPVIEQYLDLMNDLEKMDMELASQFLLMAATLLQIKSQAWLPKSLPDGEWDVSEPLRNLELQLLAYRRCKLLAGELKTAHDIYGFSRFGMPLSAAELGIEEAVIADQLDRTKFDRACGALEVRNRSRFHDLRGNVRYLLQRERISVKAKMKEILGGLAHKTRLFFTDLFPSDRSAPERIAGFLALLELMHLNRISVRQDGLFAPILMSAKRRRDDVAL